MDCARVAQEEILEGYLLGRLSEKDRDAFEEHYFECAQCFEEVRTLQAVRSELAEPRIKPESRTPLFFGWRAAAWAATLAIVLLGLALWLRQPASSSRETTIARTSPQPPPEPSQRRPTETTGHSEPSIAQLAQFEPPRYEPTSLRGPRDEASQRFSVGMEHYLKADYTDAVEDLRAARQMDPDAAHVSFYLGVSELLLGHTDAATDLLQQTIALGDSPYLEDAHFYLAKAFLQPKYASLVSPAVGREGTKVVAMEATFDRAEAQLNQVIKLRGPRSEEAKRLLAEIERIKKR